jgi:hypothetical protein
LDTMVTEISFWSLVCTKPRKYVIKNNYHVIPSKWNLKIQEKLATGCTNLIRNYLKFLLRFLININKWSGITCMQGNA